jgi:hypothetical protein
MSMCFSASSSKAAPSPRFRLPMRLKELRATRVWLAMRLKLDRRSRVSAGSASKLQKRMFDMMWIVDVCW